jgi:hypothetical protein
VRRCSRPRHRGPSLPCRERQRTRGCQFFGSALQVTPRSHALVPDGVFVPGEGGVRFEVLPPPTQGEVERLVPRANLTRFHGVSAPGAKLRPFRVPQAGAEAASAGLEAAGRKERMKQRTPRVDFRRGAQQDIRLREGHIRPRGVEAQEAPRGRRPLLRTRGERGPAWARVATVSGIWFRAGAQLGGTRPAPLLATSATKPIQISPRKDVL